MDIVKELVKIIIFIYVILSIVGFTLDNPNNKIIKNIKDFNEKLFNKLTK